MSTRYVAYYRVSTSGVCAGERAPFKEEEALSADGGRGSAIDD